MDHALGFISVWSDELIAAGTLAAAVLAAIGLILTRKSITHQAKSVDVATSFKIFLELRQSEKALQDLQGIEEPRMRFVLVEHFNFLELLAQLHNSGSFPKQTNEICKDFLLNHLAVLEANDHAKKILQQSVTSGETFSDLTAFYHKHKNRIARRRDEIIASQERSS